MEITLKNIYARVKDGGEHILYQATLYIDGYKVGVVTNDGDGGATMYRPLEDRGNMLIREAEAWCRKQPAVVCPDIMLGDKPMTIPMDLEIYLETKVVEWFNQKESQRFRRKIEKEMVNAIVFGEPWKTFRMMRYRRPIAELIRFNKGIDRLRQDIHSKVIPMLEENEKILNTNVPPYIRRLLEVPAEKWVSETNG